MALSGEITSYSTNELELVHSDLDSKVSHSKKHGLTEIEVKDLKKQKLRIKEELRRRQKVDAT